MPEPVFDPAAATATPVSAGALPWSLADESIWLLPECALWWPAGATLFVADLHLGKAATFRARGLPVPSGTTQHNLARLAQLVQQHRAERLVLLPKHIHTISGTYTHTLYRSLSRSLSLTLSLTLFLASLFPFCICLFLSLSLSLSLSF